MCRADGLWSRHKKRLESSSEGPPKCGEDRPSVAHLQGTKDRTEDGLEYQEVEGREGVFEGEKELPDQGPWNSHGQTLPIIRCTKSQGHRGGPRIFPPAVLTVRELGRTQRASRQMEKVDEGTGPCVVAHGFNTSTWEAAAGRSL